MNELEEIVANLQKLGKSQEEINMVIKYYDENKVEPGKLTDPALGTDSGSGDGFSESVQDRTLQPNIVIPEVIGDAPDLTMDDITMTDEERTEFDRKAEEQRQKGIEGQKLYLRKKQIKDNTGLLPSNYPSLITSTEWQHQPKGVSYMALDEKGGAKVNIYEQVDLKKMEEITASVTSEYRGVFNSLMSSELEALQNYAEDPLRR